MYILLYDTTFVRVGQSVDSVLAALRNRHQPLLRVVLDKYKQYKACVGLLYTGYFKRSAGRDPLWNFEPPYRPAVLTDADADTGDFWRRTKDLYMDEI